MFGSRGLSGTPSALGLDQSIGATLVSQANGLRALLAARNLGGPAFSALDNPCARSEHPPRVGDLEDDASRHTNPMGARSRGARRLGWNRGARSDAVWADCRVAICKWSAQCQRGSMPSPRDAPVAWICPWGEFVMHLSRLALWPRWRMPVHTRASQCQTAKDDQFRPASGMREQWRRLGRPSATRPRSGLL